MTEKERKKLCYIIALAIRTKPSYIYIERINEVTEKEREVYVTYKGFRYGALVCGNLVLRTWRVI